MVKITNIFGDVYSGQAGKAGVFARWKGRQYRRKYVIPANPKTLMQVWIRASFIAAVVKWHAYGSLQRLAFSYLATGLVMSGFNLLVSRWQKATAASTSLPLDPKKGIKQIGHTKLAKNETNLTPTVHVFTLGFQPNVIGSFVYTKGATNPAMDAYAEIEMGDVRIPVAITKCDGAKAVGNVIAEGDQLVISYTSGGRTITREVLFTVPADPLEIPAKATIGLAIRTKYYPIDFGSVVIEVCDVSEEPDEYTQLESLEIDSILGKIYFDMTDCSDADSEGDYDTYTAIESAKMEVTKVDTSFITWRKYSDAVGFIPIAQTIEDETYDLVVSAGTYISELRAAQTAILTTKHEYIEMAPTA